MTDFLTQLVNRTLGLTPSVQPSIPSMYVPETVQGSSFVVDSDEQTTREDEILEIPLFPRTIKTDTEKFFNQEAIAALPIPISVSRKEIGREGVSGDLVAQITDAAPPLPLSSTDSSEDSRRESSATADTRLFSSQEEDSQQILGARTLVNEENSQNSSPSPLRVKGKVQNPKSLDIHQASNSDTDNNPPLPPLTRMVDRANLTNKSLASSTDKPPAVPHPLPPTTINSVTSSGDDEDSRRGGSREQGEGWEITNNQNHPATRQRPINGWEESRATTENTNYQAAILVDRHQSRQERIDSSNVPSNLASEPTIRVSIGRIEVRAVQPPAIQPAQPISPPAPKLSLDDYLRRRNGGQQ